MIEIDGSQSHGGGSIVRIASGFAALQQKQLKITNIRAGRPNPGLQEQHLNGLRALASICNGKLLGDELGSQEIVFTPDKVASSFADISINTAGSVGLVIQPILIGASGYGHRTRLNINGGGTMVKWAPPTDFLENVTFKLLEKMGYKIEFEITRHGFYPRGGARMTAEITPPDEFLPLVIPERGEVTSIHGISIASNDLEYGKVAERQSESSTRLLEKYFDGIDIDIKNEYVNADCSGSCLTVWMETENSVIAHDILGEKGLRADIVGNKVADELISMYESGVSIDSYAADQIIPFMAMSSGSMLRISEMTDHIKTSIWLSELFTGKKFLFESTDKGILVKI